MIDIELRAYQDAAVEQLRDGIRRGHRKQVLCAPPGSGKTITSMWFVQSALRKGHRVAFLCDRVPLVEQASEAFAEYEIPHGVAQGDNTFGRHERIQVCSAQTIEKRGFWPGINLLIVDEAHRQRKATLKFVNEWDGITIGLSATPFARGMADTYSNVVNARTTNELLKDGWLSECRVFESKRLIDMKGASTKIGGEWSDSAAEERGTVIVGDVVSEWIEKTNHVFGRPVKTLFSGPTVAYCERLCGEFQRAGYDFRMSSYLNRDRDADRQLVKGFKNGDFLGLGSVEKYNTGLDVPDILCLIAARPYRKSFTSWMQLVGRLMRIAEGKTYGLLLDFCIEKNQRVLTDRGLVPICEVKKDDLLWDGTEWVEHGGAYRIGNKEVMEYAGLTATPDHKVWTQRGWMELRQAAGSLEALAETGVEGEPVRLRAGRFRSGRVPRRYRESDLARESRVRGLRIPVDSRTQPPQERVEQGLSQLQSAATRVSEVVMGTLCGDEAALYEPELSRLRELRGAGDRVQVEGAEGCVPVDHGELGASRECEGHGSGQDRQRGRLRTWQPAVGTSPSQPEQPARWQGNGSDAQVSSVASRGSVCRLHAAFASGEGEDVRADCRAMDCSVEETEREVWDIHNAGPRNRFTCEGVLVHNCGNYLGFHGDMMEFFQNGCTDLKSAKKDKDRKRQERNKYEPVCKRCGFVMKVTVVRCPSCGLERRTPRSRVETAAGRMEETEGITAKTADWKRPENREATWVHICRVASHRHSGDAKKARAFAFAQFKGLFPDSAWPRSGFHMDFGTPDEAVRKAIMHRLIRYWKGKEKRG